MNKADAQKYIKYFRTLFAISMIAAITGVLAFVALFIIMLSSIDKMNYSIILIILFASILCGIVSFVCNRVGKEYKRKYFVASGQFKSVKDVIAHEEALAKEREEARAQQQKAEADRIYRAQHPQCPACRGNNTRRISTTKRVVSTSLVGLASSTIGKQYECLDCSHKW